MEIKRVLSLKSTLREHIYVSCQCSIPGKQLIIQVNTRDGTEQKFKVQ